MPLALRDLQAAFAAHVIGGDSADLAAAVVGDAIPAAARLASIATMSSRASAPRWPRPFRRCRPWSASDFFRGLARAFIGQALPGAAGAGRIRRGLPGLHRRLRSGARPAVPGRHRPARLGTEPRLSRPARRPAEGGRPSRSAGRAAAVAVGSPWRAGSALVSSHYPLDRIWEASQPGAAERHGRPGRRPPDLLVLRRPDDAAFVSPGARRGCLRSGAWPTAMSLEGPRQPALQADRLSICPRPLPGCSLWEHLLHCNSERHAGAIIAHGLGGIRLIVLLQCTTSFCRHP